MTDPPDWLRDLEQAAREAQKGLTQVGGVFAAQGAMGWAYRGDIDGARQALASMDPDQLRELSAATMLAALADEELSTR